MDLVPDKPSKSRKGAGGNHRKNSPAVKAYRDKLAAEAAALAEPLEAEPVLNQGGVEAIRRPAYLLDAIAIAVWDDLVPDLNKSGKIGQIDASLLVAYCMDTAVYMRSLEMQAKLFESTTENRQKLLLDQADKSLKRILLMAEHLGIGQKARLVTSKPLPSAPGGAPPQKEKEVDPEIQARKDFIRYGRAI